MNPLRRSAIGKSAGQTSSPGPSTPLCGTPRSGSPVDDRTQYGTAASAMLQRRSSEEADAEQYGHDELHQKDPGGVAGMSRSRVYALIAVCTLSIGSHFAMYQLGPLKSRLHREMGTSNAQFSLLIAAYNLNSTWTPLVAGLFVARFGTGWSSIATTGCILIGQCILLLGVLTSHLVIMTLGLFIFGLGVTPLAVVQETLVARLAPPNHLGMSLALGLVLGKLSSFVSSLISLPLAEGFGDSAPFGLAVLLCAGSFVGNMARLAFGWGREVGEGEVKEKRRFSWDRVSTLGDVFWVYIVLNVFSGMIWAPFLHLSANIVKVRYGLTEGFAATQAAILLSGALILYPVTGFITDRLSPSTPRTTFRLLFLSSILTCSCYLYLTMPPSITHTPMPGLIFFTLGHGMSTLLLVLLVPRFLPPALVPLGLGLHKSMEMASSAMSQTLAGIWLDHGKASDPDEEVGQAVAVAGLIKTFLLINLLQLICVLVLWRFESSRRSGTSAGTLEEAEEYEQLPMNDLPPLDSDSDDDDDYDDVKPKLQQAYRDTQQPPTSRARTSHSNEERRPAEEAERELLNEATHPATGPTSALARTDSEKTRSRLFLIVSIGWIVLVWIVFLADAYMDLL